MNELSPQAEANDMKLAQNVTFVFYRLTNQHSVCKAKEEEQRNE